ncbi:MAG: diguanylate cyclase/phosphodiesterase with PAS/PAC sensor(s) [Gallionellaceae bacterium]|nr:MAG: diguanylate cyclase/phosphodiesterase with PAS/PAC sensor(s) [Gallionellaceae bacterium]
MSSSLTFQSAVPFPPAVANTPRLLEILYKHSDEAIIIADADARIISVNPAFTRASGYVLDEVYGKNPKMLSSGKHDAEFYHQMWSSITTSGSWAGEILDRHKEGHLYPKWMKIIALKDDADRVTHYISIATDISARKEAEESIEFLAYYDVLTGLPNRTLLHDRIKQQISAAHRDKQKFAVMFLDLDRFKYVNDSMGHAVGDQLLQVVASRLLEKVREGDTVSRIGGDEFVILLRDTDAEGAAHVAQILLDELSLPCDLNGIPFPVHATIGISLFPDNGSDIGTLLKQADAAMYRAKEEGRNNFRFFTDEMNTRINRIFSMEKDLRLATERKEFSLFFQPQMDMTSGKICGAEALIRWDHPEKGRISPAEFIPVAEETGQIIAIGEWVLRTACGKIAEWRQQGIRPFPVAVNLSLRQLLQPDFAQLVAAMLERYGLLPNELELEFTESILLSEASIALDFMTSMRKLGVRLSIDDFGTGYSSLSYLKKMPVHKLKIDQSFIRDIHADQNDEAIVRSIIALARHFNLSVIAEGIETREQLDFLKRLGCDEMQGYFYAPPLPENEFLRFVRDNHAATSLRQRA